ncbi:GNAT family N-acetyltransferase [Nissabacter sp. SGAir0207]|uniref:GNAT family N-acetyltransferase n=1 Tax=Nissabacter sp. SGAir0207 TaxID=2126321 RepID=UPI0010CD2368|nr:GNAT family N-acetyltransferase [Nissabacter sp. SGAir0207]QCR36955.1 N-acetyltransferase [Nissabacter sp. SGAir0207]
MIPHLLYRDSDIEIRVPEEEDAPQLCSAVRRSLVEIGRWESWCTSAYTVAESLRFLRDSAQKRSRGSEYNFNLFERASGEVAGAISLNRISYEYRMANVGYWIRSDLAGRGLAPLAVRAISAFAFERLALTRLEIVAMEGNLRSCRVAEKVGATAEGLHRNRLYFHGKPCHAWVYSLIPGDISPPDAALLMTPRNATP